MDTLKDHISVIDILEDDIPANETEDSINNPVILYDAWEHRFEEND